MKHNLLNYSLEALTSFVIEMGEKPFRAKQLFKWIHHSGVTDFSQMTDIAKGLRDKLSETCEINPPKVIWYKEASDGTEKYLIQFNEGNSVECVFIPDGHRGTLCVSSQVGCTLNCSFCSTGKQGFNRNLSTAEIIGQVWQVHQARRGKTPQISNVVMMGMGEPLYNYDNVIAAMSIMMDDLGFGLSKRRVTLSTAGVVPQIQALKQDSDVALAISLHAPTNELRDVLVPLNKKYPIEVLMSVCQNHYPAHSHRSITYEYVMIDGVNDSQKHAKDLIRLFNEYPHALKLNLIPFNPFPGSDYKRSSDEAIKAFRERMLKSGFITTVRRTRGDDIDAACGQLVGAFMDRTKRKERFAVAATAE